MALKSKMEGMDPLLKWAIITVVVGTTVASLWGFVAHMDSLSEHKPSPVAITQTTTSGGSSPSFSNVTAGPSSPITNNANSNNQSTTVNNQSVDQKQISGRDASQVGIDNSTHTKADVVPGHKK